MALIECVECKASISDKATACPKCGYSLGTPSGDAIAPSAKSPYIGALLSLLLCGLGQVYVRQIGKGAAWFAAAAVFSMGINIGLTIAGAPIEIVGIMIIILGIVMQVLSAIDAYKVASKLAAGHVVGAWDFFPS